MNSVPTDASGLEINFGSFDLSGTDVATVSNLAGATPNPTGPAFQSVTDQLDNDSHSGDASFLSQLQTLPGGGFDFPILNNPTNVFGLFLGQNETLFDYELPDLSLHFQYSQFFPVIGPLGVNFTGRSADTHIGFGYDTTGLSEFASNGNAADLADGFYISDRQNADGTGPVEPALTLSGTIAGGAELDAIVVDVSVDAGITATVNFSLNDPSGTGKIRFSQVTLAGLFCVMGELDAVFFATLKIGVDIPFVGFVGYQQSFNIGDFKLLDFGSTCNTNAQLQQPVLASVDSSGTLTLNMGPNASKRLYGNTTDGDESFTVDHVSGSPSSPGGETVAVEAFGFVEDYSGVRAIYAEGGAGNNSITIDPGVLSPATLWGAFNPATNPGQENNFGNNVLTAGGGPSTLYAGGGKDTLKAGTANDTLYGGSGQDILIGGPGNDLLVAGSGDDQQLTAGTGNSTLIGGAGDDLLEAGAGTDLLEGGSGGDTMISSTGDATLQGGTGNDLFILANPPPASHLAAQTLVVSGGGQPGDIALISGNGTETGLFLPDASARLSALRP